jgi:Domain of unknown function (DUF1932)
LAAFEGLGLKVRIMEAPIGAASALKMAYAGINKGVILLVTAMVLGAARAGAAEALQEELAESQRGLLDRMARTIPDMFSKAYRWGPEMKEIAGFLADDPTTSRIYRELATLCRRFAADCSGEGVEIARVFFRLHRRKHFRTPILRPLRQLLCKSFASTLLQARLLIRTRRTKIY